MKEMSIQDQVTLSIALDLIQSTDAWKACEEDPDFTLHQAEYYLGCWLNGKVWI